MAVERLHCCVPMCTRSRKPDPGLSEWICGEHWRGVSARAKQQKNRNARFIRREMRRNPLANQYWKLPPGPERTKFVEMWELHRKIWVRCRAEAIESAVGI